MAFDHNERRALVIGSLAGSAWPLRQDRRPALGHSKEAASMKIGVLAADGFQDSEYFLPKIEIEKLGVATEVISLRRDPIEIYSFFSRIGLLDVQKAIDEANPEDYIGILVPGGAKSPAILAESEAVLSFLRHINSRRKLVAPICRGTLLVAKSDIVNKRHITGFHMRDQFPDLVVQPTVEKFGGIWSDDKPVVIDGNLISSRHPDDVPQFASAIRTWLSEHTNLAQSP